MSGEQPSGARGGSLSLLAQLPAIVQAGRREAERVLDGVESRARVTLQTRELVLPGRDSTRLAPPVSAPGQIAHDMNRLIYGDNMLAMAALLAGDESRDSYRGRIDLIYIDPPFDSKADYRSHVELPGATVDQRPTVLEQFAYSDTWSEGTASYLAMLVPRIVLMRELLSETGQVFVQLDWHVGHYVKLIMDDIFGRDAFRNEIVWCYSGGATPRRDFPRKHDVLFRYAKGGSWFYEPEFRPYAENTQQVGKVSTYNAGSRDSLDIDLERGTPVTDWWTDIRTVTGWAPEKLSFQTQKPEALVERSLKTSCPAGGLVADFFAGSGTTAAVAERLGYRWVVGDLGKPAVMVTRKRLIDQGARPFLYEAIGDYQVEQARSTLGRRFRVGELAQVVLRLFGALPLPREENPSGNLGRLPGSKTLVLADSPSRMTTVSTLQRAQDLRATMLGGFDRVVVLGWNFTASIGQDIEALNDDALEVLAIPPDLLDRLRKKGTMLDKLSEEVRFSSLQDLEIEPPLRTATVGGEELEIELRNYVLLSPDALSLDEKNRAALRHLMNTEPLTLIEYWAIDPDYDGVVFRSVWQDYRGNVDNDGDPLRVVPRAALSLSDHSGPRRVCVRAVDVFGFESEVVVDAVELSS